MAITLDGSNVSTVGVPNRATSQNSTSGTVIDFTGIPSGVRNITVMFNGVSTNGTSQLLVQLGTSGGFTTSGYTAGAITSTSLATSTAGFVITAGSTTAAQTHHGSVIITNVSGNIWVSNGNIYQAASWVTNSGGSVSLAAALTQLRVTSVTPDTFDAGSVNILYE